MQTPVEQHLLSLLSLSFGNSIRDTKEGNGVEPRQNAIVDAFHFAMKNDTHFVIGTEGYRMIDGKNYWEPILNRVEKDVGYTLAYTALLGDQSTSSFGIQVFINKKTIEKDSLEFNTVCLNPENEDTFQINRAVEMKVDRTDKKFLFVHLPLYKGDGEKKFENALSVLKKVVYEYIQKGYIVSGDFNLTMELREKLEKECPQLWVDLHMIFGRNTEIDISFYPFQSDFMDQDVANKMLEHIVETREDGKSGCATSLDAVCSMVLPVNVQRFLPYTPEFKELPTTMERSEVIKSIKEKCPRDSSLWASDHFLIGYTV
jgi:hypothetical protein